MSKHDLPANQSAKPVERLKSALNQKSIQDQFKNALGEHADQFTASLIAAFNDTLKDCEPMSVIKEALTAAVLKLPITKTLGFAYLVPYNRSVKTKNGWDKNF